MGKKLLWGIVALLLVASASAYTIADYPGMFFKQKQFTATVVRSSAGDSPERTAANLIINDLQRAATTRGLRATAVKISNVNGSGDEIVIGTPCGSLRVRQLLGVSAGKCTTALPAEQGLILVRQDGATRLIITGSNGDMVLDTAKVLTDRRQQLRLKVGNATVVRKLYQKYYIASGRKFLDIGQTIGAETPVIATNYPYVTYRPFNQFWGTQYGAIVSTENPDQRAYIKFPPGQVMLNENP
jgi:hypothetical protein